MIITKKLITKYLTLNGEYKNFKLRIYKGTVVLTIEPNEAFLMECVFDRNIHELVIGNENIFIMFKEDKLKELIKAHYRSVENYLIKRK